MSIGRIGLPLSELPTVLEIVLSWGWWQGAVCLRRPSREPAHEVDEKGGEDQTLEHQQVVVEPNHVVEDPRHGWPEKVSKSKGWGKEAGYNGLNLHGLRQAGEDGPQLGGPKASHKDGSTSKTLDRILVIVIILVNLER